MNNNIVSDGIVNYSVYPWSPVAANGTEVADHNMKLEGTYSGMGWSFGPVWKIDEGNAYPMLNWE